MNIYKILSLIIPSLIAIQCQFLRTDRNSLGPQSEVKRENQPGPDVLSGVCQANRTMYVQAGYWVILRNDQGEELLDAEGNTRKIFGGTEVQCETLNGGGVFNRCTIKSGGRSEQVNIKYSPEWFYCGNAGPDLGSVQYTDKPVIEKTPSSCIVSGVIDYMTGAPLHKKSFLQFQAGGGQAMQVQYDPETQHYRQVKGSGEWEEIWSSGGS